MRTRPRTDRRRGIVRAGLTVLVLLILLLVALLIAASVNAPTAKAPQPPPTPGRVITPLPVTSPTGVPRAPVTPAKKKKSLGLLRPLRTGSLLLAEIRPHAPLRSARPIHLLPSESAAVSADGRTVAYFGRRGGAYQPSPLHLYSQRGFDRIVARGDRYVSPVLSADGRRIAFVRLVSSGTLSRPRWVLSIYDSVDKRVAEVANVAAMNLAPLGWTSKGLIYSVANATDTSLFAYRGGRRIFVNSLLPQPLVHAELSPDGRYVAFGAPTGCRFCTIDLYDMRTGSVWGGPTGMVGDSDFAWSQRRESVVANFGARLAVIGGGSHAVNWYRAAPSTGLSWGTRLRARTAGGIVSVLDPVTERTVQTSE